MELSKYVGMKAFRYIRMESEDVRTEADVTWVGDTSSLEVTGRTLPHHLCDKPSRGKAVREISWSSNAINL